MQCPAAHMPIGLVDRETMCIGAILLAECRDFLYLRTVKSVINEVIGTPLGYVFSDA